jgi:DNA-binding response OmpR family regulator
MKARILIAEDDANIRQGLVTTLESEGYDVTAAADGAQALRLFPQQKFDLVILDIMMPKQSGYDVCRVLRQQEAQIPIVFLSAKSEEIDKVLGLRLGADDYVTKPFGVHELLARIEAVLRRSRKNSSTTDKSDELPALLHFGAALVDRKQFTVALPKQAPVSLTAREMKLIESFAVHPNEVLTRDALLNAAWGVDYFGTTRTLDQHIVQVRKKIEIDPETPQTILTVHGIGYRYVATKSL